MGKPSLELTKPFLKLKKKLKELNKEIVESNTITRKLRKASSPIKEDVDIFPSDFIGF